jgi:hypothetical protein
MYFYWKMCRPEREVFKSTRQRLASTVGTFAHPQKLNYFSDMKFYIELMAEFYLLILFLTFSHDSVIRKDSSIYPVISSSRFMGSAKLITFS